jgi:ComF family protein
VGAPAPRRAGGADDERRITVAPRRSRGGRGGEGRWFPVWRFLSFVLDVVLPGECLVCRSAVRSYVPFSLPVTPPGWPPALSDFLSTEFRMPLVRGLSVRAEVLCPRCWLTLEPTRGPGSIAPRGALEEPAAVVSPFYENDALLAVIRFLKFSGGKAAAPALSWWMANALSSFLAGDGGGAAGQCLLVPVPLHRRRERSRGYNQATLLARGVGEALGIEVDETLLARVRNTQPQSKLEPDERAENVRNAFVLLRRDRARGRRLILVDDLITTGETIRACRGALAPADPATVMALCAGRARGISDAVSLT